MKKTQLLIFIIISLISFMLIIFTQFDSGKSQANNFQTQTKLPLEIQKIVEQHNIKQPENKGDVRLLVISDLNSAYGSTEYDDEVHLAIKMIPFWQPDLVLCSGDMIAGQKPSLTPTQIRAMWQSFDRYVAQPIRDLKIPFGFTVGNHDASSAIAFDKSKFLFQQERDLAVEYWQNPKNDPQLDFIDRDQFPFYYTFKQDDIFFLVWDGSSSRISDDNLAWVEKSLDSSEANNAKMKILIGHLPLYAVAEGRNTPGEVLNNAEGLRTMLEKHNVHTYISGHHHAYYPAHKGELQLLHTGALGGGSRLLIEDSTAPMKTITVVDVNFDDRDLTRYTTYSLPKFEIVASEKLPRLLIGHNGMVLRRDIKIEDLTKEEKNNCLDKLDLSLCQ